MIHTTRKDIMPYRSALVLIAINSCSLISCWIIYVVYPKSFNMLINPVKVNDRAIRPKFSGDIKSVNTNVLVNVTITFKL